MTKVDELVKSQKTSVSVISAKAGIQRGLKELDARLSTIPLAVRGHDSIEPDVESRNYVGSRSNP